MKEERYERRIFEDEEGRKVVHIVKFSLSELKSFAVKPVQAEVPETTEKLTQVASSLRRIASANKLGIRGEESRDNVLVISKCKKDSIFFKKKSGIVLSKDLHNIEVLKRLVNEKRLMYNRKNGEFTVKDSSDCEEDVIKEIKDKMVYVNEDNSIEQVVTPTLPITLCSGYENLMEIVKKNNAIAGINGGYFLNFPEEMSKFDAFNDPVGLLMVDGKITNPPIFNRGTILISEEGIEFTKLSIMGIIIRIGNIKFGLRGSNEVDVVLKLNSEHEASIYTSSYGKKIEIYGEKVIIVGNRIVKVTDERETEIPGNGFIILLREDDLKKEVEKEIAHMKTNEVSYNITSMDDKKVVHGLSAGPILLKDGKEVELNEEFGENVPPTRLKFNVRAPRSVFATSEDEILFITLDDDRKISLSPKERYSIGAILDELKEILKEIGCKNAINLDGGGSSTLILNNEVKNRPSDGFLRAISTALIITRRG